MRALLLAIPLLLAGCGIPGPPVPPTAHIPRPVEDLEASRSGDTVTLRFTPPTHNTDGSRIETGRAVSYEIRRAELPGTADAGAIFREEAKLHRVVPSEAAGAFTEAGQIVLRVETETAQPGTRLYFGVRVRDAKGRDAGYSNLASVGLAPAPAAPAGLQAEVVEEGVRLTWMRLPEVDAADAGGRTGYRIFRRRSPIAGGANGEKEKEAGFELLTAIPPESAEKNEYTDRTVEWGAQYAYRLRTVLYLGGEQLEGFDSEPVEVLAKDMFPPAPPARLVAVGGPDRIDLSWDASPSADVAGYAIHRTRDGKEDPILLPLEPQLSLTYTDTEVDAGAEYRYVVIAVDEAGNESPPSNPATAAAISFGGTDEEQIEGAIENR